MNMIKLVTITWVIIVTLITGVKWFFFRSPQTKVIWKATRTLSLNSQITSGDVKSDSGTGEIRPGDLLGRHLLKNVEMGKPVEPGDVSDYPSISSHEADARLFIYSLTGDEAPLIGVINPGDKVVLYSQDDVEAAIPNASSHSLRVDLTVAAVHRSTAVAPGNWLLLQSPARSCDNVTRALADGTNHMLTIVSKKVDDKKKVRN